MKTEESVATLIAQHFRGREDYIAVAQGEGFRPVKCAHGIHPSWLEKHLTGETCLGFYVLSADSRAWCSCVDIDNKPEHPNPQWRAQAEKIYYEFCAVNLRPIVELSQSESGAHVWLFHSQPIDGWFIRQWWLAWQDRVGFSFREVFPKQSRLSGKGVGNLVRFPLWKKSRFVDVENEWAEILPEEALRHTQRVDVPDLKLIASHCGFYSQLTSPETIATGTESDVPARIRKLVSNPHSTLGRRWLNDSRNMRDPSPSAVCQSIIHELILNCVPTPEIEVAVRYWLGKHDREDKANRPEWISHSIAKGYEFVHQARTKKSTDVLTMQDCCHQYLDMLEGGELHYIPSGVEPFDACCDGVAPGEVCVIAGKPSLGKSAFLFQWIDHAAHSEYMPLLLSEEMMESEIGKRRLLSIVDKDGDKWRQSDVPRFRDLVNAYYQDANPVRVVCNCCTIERAEEVIDQMCEVYGVDLVAIDYLQLFGSADKSGSRYEVISTISRRIKQCAQRNSCAVLLISQLSRQVEHRTGKEPQLSDLRDSGQIEQDADTVCFVRWRFREDPKKYKDDSRRFEIFVKKRRNGPIRVQPAMKTPGLIVTTFDPYRQKVG